MTYRLGWILILLAAGLDLPGADSADQQEFRITGYTKQDYGAESQNWSVTHDRDGNVYVANNSGLLEYDGNEWTFHPAPNGTVIRAVAVDTANRIFSSGYREIGYWTRDMYGDLQYHSLNKQAEDLFSQNDLVLPCVCSFGKESLFTLGAVVVLEVHKHITYMR